MSARAVARILPPGAVQRGSIRFDGRDVTGLKGQLLRDYRNDVGVIFQDPRAHINPVRSIGDFMTEALRTLRKVSKADAQAAAVRMLEEVGIPDGARRLRQHPHELSGGLLQRVMIATTRAGSVMSISTRAKRPSTSTDRTTPRKWLRADSPVM